MQAALEHLIYLWKGCLSSFVPVRSLLRSKVAQGRFGELSPWRDAHSARTESWRGQGEWGAGGWGMATLGSWGEGSWGFEQNLAGQRVLVDQMSCIVGICCPLEREAPG